MSDVDTRMIGGVSVDGKKNKNKKKTQSKDRERERTAQMKEGRGERLTLVFACFFFP